MPAQFEAFYENPQFAICHVPPPAMFKARIFKPPRLCAVFEIAGPLACLLWLLLWRGASV